MPLATLLADLWVRADVDREASRAPWLAAGFDDPAEALYDLVRDEPERALEVVVLILERHGQRAEVRERVGAGPLQALLRGHAARTIDALERAAPRLAGVRGALEFVIDARLDDGVRRRLRALRR
ncbi:MAG: hypothetical protein R3F34_09655 [Planctomycetota bacterium]